MLEPQTRLSQDSPAWQIYTYLAFSFSVGLMVLGIWNLPVESWVRGYLAMGLFFTISSTITLCKTSRDNHEARKLVNRISEAKTEKLLHEFDLKP
ncbi:MAG: hypothetical protein H7Z41_04460 [Cytophagales bacterium]|nr:hypothetical protein [Armatimonadota bacterium]